MARTLDDQVYQQPQLNYTPGFAIPNAYPSQQYKPQPVLNITQSIANLSMVPIPQPPPPPKPPSPPPSLPSLTAPLPILSQLQAAAKQVQNPTHDPALKIAWCRDVFFLVDRSQGNSPATDPPVGPVTISDLALSHIAHIAVQIALQLASSWSPSEGRPKMPLHVAEAISIRATLASTGSFPEFVRHNPRTAFRDFEAAARGGFIAAWFRLGRDYENFNDHAHAKECFERGAKLGVESCIYVSLFRYFQISLLKKEKNIANGDGPLAGATVLASINNTCFAAPQSRCPPLIHFHTTAFLRLCSPPPLRVHPNHRPTRSLCPFHPPRVLAHSRGSQAP